MNRENEIASQIVDASYKIHSKLGPGLLESVYERLLAYELNQRGFEVETQVSISIAYDDLQIDNGFRADIVVGNLVIVELKSVEQVVPVHKKQLITYLKLSDMRLGLLINFGAPLIKEGITRIVNNMPD